MTASTVFGLINNTALLLALGLLYDTLLYNEHYGDRLSVSQFLAGVFIGSIGIAVMMTRWELTPGVVFDTRSVLLSVTGLFFGAVPTIMAVFMTALFRLYSGGMGMWTGVAVIVTSGGIGLTWRHFRKKDLGDVSIGELYLFGVSVHAAMLLWMFLMPWPTALSVLSRIGVPVMLIFPAGTVLLGKLMSGRHARKNVEKTLRESQKELADIFSMSLDMICIADINSVMFLKVNPAFTRILGYSENELLNRSFLDFIHPEDVESTVKVVSDSLKKGEKVFDFTNRYRCKDGTYRWLNWVSHPILERGITFAVAHDITDRKKAEKDKQKMEFQLRRSQKMESIGTLAGGVAHEINNPINGIMNYAQLIKDKIDDGSPVAEYASEIINETKRVAQIVQNLLAFSRKAQDSHRSASIKDIVDNTMSLIKAVFRRDQIRLEVNVPEDLPAIKCRDQQIQQVIMNLMTNARDALNEKYPAYDENKLMKISSNLFEKDGRRWIRTTVEDRGIGIDPDVGERMFDPFFTTKERTVGTGLGLSISYGILKDHHGELTFESKPGQYTKFHMDLPVDNG